MCWRKLVELFRLCNTPATIISPIPFFSVSLFLLSRKEVLNFDVTILLAGITFSLLSNFGSNLWNHYNDIKEDTAQGKKTILTQDTSMQKVALIISVLLYVSSLFFAYYLSIVYKKQIILFFIIWALITWWYSDNLILKKLIGFRLKDHYLSEFVTYAIAWPMYTLSIWLIYSDLNAVGMIITIAFFFFSISGLMLKDLKDISGDRKAGLRTFGVVFHPSQLIKYSCFLIVLYYLVILNPFTLNLFSKGILTLSIPFIYFLKKTFLHMYKKNWILDIGDLNALKNLGYSTYAFIIIIGLSNFI